MKTGKALGAVLELYEVACDLLEYAQEHLETCEDEECYVRAMVARAESVLKVVRK